jgi:class 3 adenylate cyclase/tetratricopeptide (TPR) repeat protein
MVCGACGRAATEGQRFCVGCGRPLAIACPACGRDAAAEDRFCGSCGASLAPGASPRRSPSDYTPHHLAERILRQRGALEGERKEVTVLFADVKGSMDLAASVDPEDWHAILDRFFAVLSEGVHRFEGSINQYTGDGIMALFGAPLALEEHARHACHAALWLRDAVRELGRELRREKGVDFAARFGLNSGTVVVGAIGDDLRMDYTAQGQVVGLAARMEKLAEAGAVYLTPATAKLVERYFELEDLGSFQVKGLSERMHVFELRGAAAAVTRLDVSRARGLSRFVGRDRELEKLSSLTASGTPRRRIAVVARAGQGKSRLCFEFAERKRAAGATVFGAVGFAHARTTAYMPVLQLFREVLGLTGDERGPAALERVAGRILLLGERFRPHVSVVGELLGLADAGASLDPDARKNRLLEVLAGLIDAAGRDREVILWIEDLHWFDPASESFLRELLARSVDPNVVVAATYRPEYDADWMQGAGFETVRLEPLGPADMRHLLEDHLGTAPSLAGAIGAIAARAGGNPFFAEEMVRELVESGGVAGVPGRYEAASPDVEIELPATVQAVLAARIDRLDADAKSILQSAAVIGKDFGRRLLEPVTDLDPARLEAGLRELVSRGFVYLLSRYPSEEYSFEHPLTQEVADGSMLSRRRRGLHRAVARAIEVDDPARTDERAALIAGHYEASDSLEEAVEWHRRAAIWTNLADLRETFRHWTRIRELVPADTEARQLLATRLRACREILSIATRVGVRTSELGEIRSEGRDAARRLDDTASQAAIESSYALSRGLEGDLHGALESLRAARPLAERGGDLEAVVDFAITAGHVYSWCGRCLDQIAVSDLGLRRIGPNPDGSTEGLGGLTGWLLVMRGTGLGQAGDLAAGTAEIETALDLVSSDRDTEVRGFAYAHLLRLHTLSGRYDDADAAARQALELGELSGSVGVWGTTVGYHAAVDVACGRWAEAVDRLSAAIGYLEQGGIVLFRAFALAQLALARAGSGDVAGARESSRRALEVARSCGADGFAVLALFASARAAILAGDGERAADVISEAETEIARLGLGVHEPDLLIEKARLASTRGDDGAATEALARAVIALRDVGADRRAGAIESAGLDAVRPPR